MSRPRFVDGRPDGRIQDVTAVHTSRFERRSPPKEQPNRLQLPTIRGPMKCIQACTRATRRIDAARQQVGGNVGSTEKTCAGQRLRQRLRLIAKPGSCPALC
jgi:hypothetical protein